MGTRNIYFRVVLSASDRAPRTDQQPAPPSGPSPVGSHPVSRGGRAPFDRGQRRHPGIDVVDPRAFFLGGERVHAHARSLGRGAPVLLIGRRNASRTAASPRTSRARHLRRLTTFEAG